MVGTQRGFDDAQVGQEVFGLQVGVLRGHRMARGVAACQVFQGGGESRIHAGQRAPVGLVQAVFVDVGRTFGQGPHLGREVHQHGRQRELAAQVVHFGQVVAQRDLGLAAQRVFQRVGADIRVAVAVAAYPLAHAQKAVHRLVAERALEVGVEFGNFAQKGGFVVTERVFDLVGDGELGETQQPGLPELHHARAQLGFVGGQFARGQRVAGRIDGQRMRPDLVARRQQLRDVAFGVQDAFALDLGRVRGQHRRHIGMGQRRRDGFGRDAGPAQARQRHLDAALLGVAGAFMDGAAADVVAVLGQVGQVAEIGEGADHADGLVT
eukprot:Opistho-1_new@103306